MGGAGGFCGPVRTALPPAALPLLTAPALMRSGPPLVLTMIERVAAGFVAIEISSGPPPPSSAVSAYGPPGTDRSAAPPPVSTCTLSGAVANPSRASPPSVVTAAVDALTPSAIRLPPPVSACSAPVRPLTVTGPLSELTVSCP